MPLLSSNVSVEIRPIGASGTALLSNPSATQGVAWKQLYRSDFSDNFIINSMGITTPSSIDINQAVAVITIGATFNYSTSGSQISSPNLTTQLFPGGGLSQTLTASGSISGIVHNATELITLTSSGVNNTYATGSLITWMNRQYWGPKNSGNNDGAFIGTLPNSGLIPIIGLHVGMTVTGTAYVWYAYRLAAGTPRFTDEISSLNGGSSFSRWPNTSSVEI